MRVTLQARLGNARIPLQVDIGFGDVITPKATKTRFPTLLNFPTPQLLIYSKETVVAEKFEAMVKLSIINSRMKDYYDVWALSQEFEFHSAILRDAITATFRRRKTSWPVGTPLVLSTEFTGDAVKQQQWQGFVRRGRFKLLEPELTKVVEAVSDFLMPVVIASNQPQTVEMHWPKGGPWQTKR
jgi:predicted nucleotidyltransferase component of viral defense system